MHIAREHELEAQHGLPEALPANERILWQGAPDWKALAVRAFHVKSLAAYFVVLLVASGAIGAVESGSVREGLTTVVVLAPLAVFAVAVLAVLAWLAARTSVYTITDKRVVLRIGIVLSVTFNLPFARIGAASLGETTGGSADVALALEGADRIAYANLWPHARPWRLARAEPMLRAVPDGVQVARLLTRAWHESRGMPMLAVVAPAAAERPDTDEAAEALPAWPAAAVAESR